MAAAIAPLTVYGESMDAANMALCEPTCALNQGQRRQIDFIPGCPPLARLRHADRLRKCPFYGVDRK
jgi:hypothetical protein